MLDKSEAQPNTATNELTQYLDSGMLKLSLYYNNILTY